MFGWICGATGILLLAIWGGQQAEDHFWPKQAITYENAPLVPEYELRRQKDEAWVKRYLRYGWV